MKGALDVHPKVVGGTVASAIAMLVVWLVGVVFGISVPVGVQWALVVVFTAFGGWLTPGTHSADPPPTP